MLMILASGHAELGGKNAWTKPLVS